MTKLRQRAAAHGDLQHGNILVDESAAIRLVDYDGMYLPALRQLGAAEQGHRNYQHPDRQAHYDDSIDLFSAYVIDLSLHALAHEPSLWNDFHTGENLLFSADDFTEPRASRLFARLAQLPREIAERSRVLAHRMRGKPQ